MQLRVINIVKVMVPRNWVTNCSATVIANGNPFTETTMRSMTMMLHAMRSEAMNIFEVTREEQGRLVTNKDQTETTIREKARQRPMILDVKRNQSVTTTM